MPRTRDARRVYDALAQYAETIDLDDAARRIERRAARTARETEVAGLLTLAIAAVSLAVCVALGAADGTDAARGGVGAVTVLSTLYAARPWLLRLVDAGLLARRRWLAWLAVDEILACRRSKVDVVREERDAAPHAALLKGVMLATTVGVAATAGAWSNVPDVHPSYVQSRDECAGCGVIQRVPVKQYATETEERTRFVVTATDGVMVRAANTRLATPLGVLAQGRVVPVTCFAPAKEGAGYHWYRVEWRDGTAWIRADLLRPVRSPHVRFCDS